MSFDDSGMLIACQYPSIELVEHTPESRAVTVVGVAIGDIELSNNVYGHERIPDLGRCDSCNDKMAASTSAPAALSDAATIPILSSKRMVAPLRRLSQTNLRYAASR
jgi:hypothetical protein